MTTLVELPGGRAVEVATAGPATAPPLVLHHGTPGAALVHPPIAESAARHGLRTVVYARPGYGASTPVPGRSVADAAADTAAVLDALGASTFVTLGWSGGGPHALACAALLPGRCLAAATVAGVAPYGAAGLDWLAGMGAENVEEFTAALAGEEALTRFLLEQAGELAVIEGPGLADAFGDLVSEVDRRALAGDVADFLAATMRTAVSQGIAGWRDDDLAFVRDWGFPLRPACPVSLWQGGQDRMVPAAHGEWLAGGVTGAHVVRRPEHGHISLLFDAPDDILADLVSRT
jgi:pimeloyl-ACP methyl ester carboxylesterase